MHCICTCINLPSANLEDYIENNDNIFASALQAQIQNVPGSPLGAIRVTWELTHPACIRSVCVRIENSQGEVVTPNQCHEDSSISSLQINELPCNMLVKAVLELAAGVSGRADRSNDVYIGGKIYSS